jgi:hypothetical protein
MAKPTDPPTDPPVDPLKTPAQLAEERKARLKQKEERFEQERMDRLRQARDASREGIDPPPRGKEDDPPVDPPEDPPADPPADPPEDPPADPPVDPPNDDDPPMDSPEDDDEFDFFEDEDPPEDPPADPPNEDDSPDPMEPESVEAWRERVQAQGKARKLAEGRVTELEERVETLETQNAELAEQSKQAAAAQINWSSHDMVKPMWSKFDDIVGNAARTLSDAETARTFQSDANGKLLKEYYELVKGAGNAAERLEVDLQYKATLADRYGVDDGGGLVNAVKDAMQQYMDIEDKVDALKKDHENGRLSLGVKDYEASIEPFQETIEDLGNVEDDFIETAPDAVESVVGKRYKKDDEFRVKADKFKRRMTEFIFGLRPLTQDEMVKAEKRAATKSMSLSDYMKAREENFVKARAKFLNDVFYQEMAMGEYDEMRKVYSRYLAQKRKRDAARKSASKGKEPSKNPPKKKEETPVRPKDKEYIPPSRRSYTS